MTSDLAPVCGPPCPAERVSSSTVRRWVFHYDGSLPEAQRCVHVNFIDRTDGIVHGLRNGIECMDSHMHMHMHMHMHTHRPDDTMRNTHLAGEDEFLFAPYSVFTVRSAVWEPSLVADEYTVRPTPAAPLNVAPR